MKFHEISFWTATDAISLFQVKVFVYNTKKTPLTEEIVIRLLAQPLFRASRADFEFKPFYGGGGSDPYRVAKSVQIGKHYTTLHYTFKYTLHGLFLVYKFAHFLTEI